MYFLVSNENLTVLISQSFQFGKLCDIGLITENYAEKKETVTGSFYKRGFLKKFFKGFQNPQKNTYLSQSLFFNKVAGVCWSLYLTSLQLYQRETPTHACNFIKRDWHSCFPMDFAKLSGKIAASVKTLSNIYNESSFLNQLM